MMQPRPHSGVSIRLHLLLWLPLTLGLGCQDISILEEQDAVAFDDPRLEDQTHAVDADRDGWTDVDGDCDDDDELIHPGAIEICGDDQDSDCTGENDDGVDVIGCHDFFVDEDTDGFGSQESACLCHATAPIDADNDLDCYDGAPYGIFAFPGQEDFFQTHRGDGSFDFNCDAEQEPRDQDIHNCGLLCDIAGGANAGWEAISPDCGEVGDWVYGCEFQLIGLECVPLVEPKIQWCR